MASNSSFLILNSGSSSVKFAVFSAGRGLARLLSGSLDRIGLSGGRLLVRDTIGEVVVDETRVASDHDAALGILLPTIERHLSNHRIISAGHRVVHGGLQHVDHQRITPEMVTGLRGMAHLAPLHLPGNVSGIEALSRTLPDIPQFACFDTAFHRTLPRVAQMTGLPRDIESAGLRRFGFHGLSYEFIVDHLAASGVNVAAERMIIAHLGNGASMCAVKGGASVETTMGFSTLSGLLMGARPGDVDPGLILHLIQQKRQSPEEITSMLYERSGLRGVSGLTSDMRELLSRAQEPRVAEALELFCYRARYHLGGLAAVLGGLDRLVFTGGIGANSEVIRANICAGLAHLGVDLDPVANTDVEGVISSEGSVIVMAMRSDEELVAARHVARLLGSRS
ncbi:MAG TPA: acetate/propionate family kinase [Hyphomicrobiaceae bacterium]|nr:acetate/propionate family kinase [Hyphomicrobiaceae bacterium]